MGGRYISTLRVYAVMAVATLTLAATPLSSDSLDARFVPDVPVASVGLDDEVNRLECEVTRVVDGDTIWVDHDDDSDTKAWKIRFPEIDTPERGQYLYREARARVVHLLSDRQVVLTQYAGERPFGRYKRHIMHPFTVDGRNISLILVREGLAKHKVYRGGPRKFYNELKEAQELAKEEGLGIWAEES